MDRKEQNWERIVCEKSQFREKSKAREKKQGSKDTELNLILILRGLISPVCCISGPLSASSFASDWK